MLLPKGAFLGHSVPWPLPRPPSCLPYCVAGVPLSQFNMLIEFLDPQNLLVDTKIMILARILKKISGISCLAAILSAILCTYN